MPVIKSTPEATDADLSLRRAQDAMAAERAAPPLVAGARRAARAVRDRARRRGEPERIGVVFVHGIGAQEPGETLLSWSAPIVRTLREWNRQHGLQVDPVKRTQIDFQGSTIPVVALTIPASPPGNGDHPAQEWILSEAWWAAQVEPPGVRLMLGWLFEDREFSRIATGVFSGIAESGESGIWSRLEAVLVRLLVWPLTILAPVIYALSSLLRLIPIKPLQDGIARQQLDWFLNDWFGDVRILVADRVQAGNVRAKIAKTIRALETLGCTRMVVVAHSGGAIASYMTLTDQLYVPGRGDDELAVGVDRLVTHGQGLDLAWLAGHMADGGSEPGDRFLAPGDHLMEPLELARPDIRWTDYWATHDPAPAGPIGGTAKRPQPAVSIPGTTVGGESVVVHNRMSVRNDHGGYWDNDEQFVLPLMRLIETTGSATTSRFYAAFADSVRATRQRRVKALASWWSGLLVAAGAVLAVGLVAMVLGAQPLARVGGVLVELVGLSTQLDGLARVYGGVFVPIAALAGLIPAPELDVASWIAIPGPNLLGIAVVVVVTWLLGKPPIAAWNRWDAAARAAAQDDTPQEVPAGGFSGRAVATVLALVVLAVAAGLGAAADLGAIAFDLGR